MHARSDEITIALLGRFEVSLRGQVVTELEGAGRRAVELVQLLALAEGHALLRDQVIQALWPHLGPDAGAANLRKAAHHARQALGDPAAVVLRGGTVALFPDGQVQTDLECFLHQASAALAAAEPGRCAEVAATYGGEVLPGARYEEWTQQPRAHARAVQLALLRASGQWAQVVALEPSEELAYQHLMREAMARGARAAAIRWYGRLRSALSTELGITPGDVSQALYDELVEGVADTAPQLLGRQAELAACTAVLRHGEGQRHGALGVRGMAGIGKSALCRALVGLAQQEGWSARLAQAQAPDQPYAPLITIIDEVLLGRPQLLDAAGAQTRSVLAALSPAVGPAAPLEGPLSRHQVIGAFQRLLRIASDGRRTVVVLDDAHLADAASLDVLLHMSASVRDVLIVIAYRPGSGNDALEDGVSRLRRSDRLQLLDLGPLEQADATALAAATAPQPLPDDLLRRIVDLAAGNPFAISELARGADPAQPEGLAPTVSESLTDRLLDLDPDTVAVLQRIALAAGELDSATVVALTGDTEAATFAVLDRALDAGVLLVSGERYRFRHDLIRQALVAQTHPHQRVAIHRDAARRLAAAGAAPAVVARHWLAAGRPAEAAEWLLAAATQAMKVGAFRDARQQLAPLLANDATHAAALRLDAEASDMMGDPGALAAYDAAIAAAPAAEAHDLSAMRALAQLKLGDPAGALEAIAGARPTSVVGRLSEALTYAGAAALGVADPATGTEKAAESRRLALLSGDRAAIVIASWAQAAAAHARGALHDSVLADLRDTSDVPHLAVRVFDGQLCITQRFLYGARPYADVIHFADALAAEGARLGAARGHAFGVTLRGEAELLSGQLDQAEVHLTEGGRMHRAIGGATGEALALQRLAEVELFRGRPDRGAVLLTEALELARITDIGFHLLDRIYGTRIALADDPEEALAMVEEAEDAVRGPLETCPGCRITFAAPAAIASARAGELDRAAGYATETEWLAHVVMRLPAWNAALEEVRGHLAAASGDCETARARFSAAAAGFGDAGHPLEQQRCAALATDAG